MAAEPSRTTQLLYWASRIELEIDARQAAGWVFLPDFERDLRANGFLVQIALRGAFGVLDIACRNGKPPVAQGSGQKDYDLGLEDRCEIADSSGDTHRNDNP